MNTIDINADLGEGVGDDASLMQLITSCNIACGGHYGAKETIAQTIKLAVSNGVKVGAHPSYPDMANFGRKRLTLSSKQLKETLDIQLKTMISVCDALDVSLHHVKPHGALYNFAAIDESTAQILVDSILDTGLTPIIYTPKNSVLYEKAKNYLPLAAEAFIDRRYTENLQLVSRTEANAVIETPEDAWQQLKMMFEKGEVKTISGAIKTIEAKTFCIHGDNPKVLAILKVLHAKMKQYNIALE